MTVVIQEQALTFPCDGETLVGVLHQPAAPGNRGVVVVVGGPQYRIGTHRQYVLLARELAAQGIPVLRFDLRGMGDSTGDFPGFEDLNVDIRAAVDCLQAQAPSVNDVVLLGLCDGASASAFYGATDSRIGGLVLINPWVRSEQTLARAQVRHYYLQRLTSPQFWRKALGGGLNPLRVGSELLGKVAQARGVKKDHGTQAHPEPLSLPERVSAALRAFDRRVLVILGGADMTAQEFDTAVWRSSAMKDWTARSQVTLQRQPGANHTYSTAAWRRQVHDWISQWLLLP
ncbi:hydrolase 1, exosortase A system-associated [Magnetospira sp. QH-2]|uniref:hydrolase 1, exosortase A system-associated n=1 Tax=Magnetospira sp. (strain QH-2) TaxID=1288970 RepID=UPI0003E8170E|nr:hydrolase 1, exosortase A system-associated [Magnetospira sp. QH-2]CCQ72976.1 conserved protein of unknown function [hydrolase domain] [Magnetospira sp. QH-2]